MTKARSILNTVRHFLSKDTHALLLILILSALLRFPALDYPNKTVFDEAIYANYAIHGAREIPYFDIHPPLARIIFATLTEHATFTTTKIQMETNANFGDFPYRTLRTFIALFGIILPAFVYALARLLHYRPEVALVPALFVVLDNAFVVYSRTILPDTLMILASVIALALMQVLLREHGRARWLATGLLGIFLGAAISIKWTALAMLSLVALWLILSRARKEAAMAVGIALVCYVLIFTAYFTHFTKGGVIDPLLPAYRVAWIDSVTYLPGGDTWGIVRSLPAHHQVMMRSNEDEAIAGQMIPAPHPLAWPIARAQHKFWQSDDGTRRITLTGNTLLWFGMSFIFLFEIGWLMVQLFRKKHALIERTELFLVVGYIVSYFPFFLIGRPMYLYHYLTPLLFLFLLTPIVTPRIISCVTALTNDRHIGKALIIVYCILIVCSFMLSAPTTYGL